MAEVQDFPDNRADVAAKRDKDALLDHLDDLLERYLHTLHEYQHVMQELSKQLSEVRRREEIMLAKCNVEQCVKREIG